MFIEKIIQNVTVDLHDNTDKMVELQSNLKNNFEFWLNFDDELNFNQFAMIPYSREDHQKNIVYVRYVTYLSTSQIQLMNHEVAVTSYHWIFSLIGSGSGRDIIPPNIQSARLMKWQWRHTTEYSVR